MFDKVLIANRGEIALRVIKTLRRMGIRSVAVYSEADRFAPHVHFADEAVCVGPAPVAESYLNVEAILAAVRETGAEGGGRVSSGGPGGVRPESPGDEVQPPDSLEHSP